MSSVIIARLKKLQRDLDPQQLAREAYLVFKTTTPIRTGNARRNTRRHEDEVQADYAYALRLEQGWSRQAPEGMSKTAIEHVQKYIEKTSKG